MVFAIIGKKIIYLYLLWIAAYFNGIFFSWIKPEILLLRRPLHSMFLQALLPYAALRDMASQDLRQQKKEGFTLVPCLIQPKPQHGSRNPGLSSPQPWHFPTGNKGISCLGIFLHQRNLHSPSSGNLQLMWQLGRVTSDHDFHHKKQTQKSTSQAPVTSLALPLLVTQEVGLLLGVATICQTTINAQNIRW